MRQDYFFQNGRSWIVGWFGHTLYSFDTYSEAEKFATLWNVRVPSTSSNA